MNRVAPPPKSSDHLARRRQELEAQAATRLTAAEDEAPPAVTVRAVEPIKLHLDVALAAPPTSAPVFMDVDPRTLFVEGAYQRELSDKSLSLIHKIATTWDWRKFRPPVVVMSDAGGLILDGQHTAIAAASRGDLPTIPVMLVEAPNVGQRAEAFIGLNKDRLAVTALQLHRAAVAAGDEDALTIDQVCGRAGVTLVQGAYGGRKWKEGETVAIGAIGSLIDRRGAKATRELLQVLAGAGCAPISANEIKAVEYIFTDQELRDQLEPLDGVGSTDVATAIMAAGDAAVRDARVNAKALCIPYWRALGVQWFRKARKRRRAA